MSNAPYENNSHDRSDVFTDHCFVSRNFWVEKMEWLKEWIRNVAFYYLFVTVIANVLPDGKEKKTVQFFLGLLITLFLLTY